jgi:hypothetical protein
MQRNGAVVAEALPRGAQALSAALLRAEQTGMLDPSLWPALRELLLGSSDPALGSVLGPLRALVAARAHYEAAYAAVQRQLSAFPPAADVGAVGAASEALSLAMEELTSRTAALQQALAPAGEGRI